MGREAPLHRRTRIAAPPDAADAVYALLRKAIEEGRIVGGQRLASERALAADLAAPRTAVRRALQRLTAEGLVARGLGRAGSRVAERAPAEGRPHGAGEAGPQDVLEARWAFEPGLVALVVARATEADFAAMDRKLDAMHRAADQQSFREAGYGFHLEITRATRNPLLVQIFELIIAARARAGWGRLAALNATAEQRTVQTARNRRVLEALRQRDAPRATTLLRDHLATMLDEIGRNATTA
jgi:DNA-binding FadR family transcriptional regulator